MRTSRIWRQPSRPYETWMPVTKFKHGKWKMKWKKYYRRRATSAVMRIDRQIVSTGGTVTTIRQIGAAALRTAHATALNKRFVYVLVVNCGVLELFGIEGWLGACGCLKNHLSWLDL